MIVTLGDLTLDVLVKPDKHVPGRPPESVGSVTMTSGGHAANFAVWTSRLGGNCRFIGKTGQDPAAELLLWDLLKEGVLPETVAAKGSTATLTHILKAHGEVELLPDRGEAVNLKPEELQPGWLSDAEWLHLPASAFWALPIAAAAARAVHLARQAGAKISVDLDSAKGLKNYGVAKFSVMLKALRPDVVFATQDQAMLFAAGSLGELSDVAVLKMGADGCAAANADGYKEYSAESGRILDVEGADDAFDAAWCLIYLASSSTEEACSRANLLRARVAAHHGVRPKIDLRGIIK